MRRLLLCSLGLLVLGISQAQAQKKNSNNQHHQIIESNESYDLVSCSDLTWVNSSGQRTTGFPWNGCGEFVVTIDLVYVQVETVIVVCCVEGICIPNVQLPQGVEINDGQQIGITQSSIEQIGSYQISVRPGQYIVQENGRLLDLNYLVKTYK